MNQTKTAAAIQAALSILDGMDDGITEIGGDCDECGRRQLAKIRRSKTHLRRALKHLCAPASATYPDPAVWLACESAEDQ